MPTIAYFYGITIRMFFVDHPPPHFHAEYQGHEANISIETGDALEGSLPKNAVRIVREWALQHQSELLENWERARNQLPLARIPGADND